MTEYEMRLFLALVVCILLAYLTRMYRSLYNVVDVLAAENLELRFTVAEFVAQNANPVRPSKEE